MNGRAAIRKYIVYILLVLVIICASACQPTPEKEIVQQRDDFDELVQKTAEPKASEQPEQSIKEPKPTNSDEPQPTETIEPVQKYQDTFEYRDGAFKVFIDAVIDKPNMAIPVVKVEPYLFTQEDADSAIEVLMQNRPLYEFKVDYYDSKELLQQQIFELKAILAKIKSDTALDEQTRKTLIAAYVVWIGQLEKQRNNAKLDSPEWEQVTTEFVDLSCGGTGLFVKADMGKAFPATFSVTAFNDGIKSLMGFGNEGSSYSYGGIREISGDIPGMETTFSEAQVLAEDTLEHLGVADMKLDYAKLGTINSFSNEKSLEGLIDNKYFPKCYIFWFTRDINGLPLRNVDPFSGFDIEGPEYNTVWKRETLLVEVDDTGIIGYSYGYPGKITETVNDNVVVLDFDTVMEIFKKQVFYEGVWTASNVTYSEMTVTKIQMNMFRLKLKDKDEFLYVPVWDFIGTWESNVYATEKGKEFSFLTINAIDGSIINRNRGY